MGFKMKDLQNIIQSKAMRALSVLSALVFVLTSTGCIMSSISESSDSISTSSKSSSKSSDSSSDDSKESYLRDVKQYTAAYSRSNQDIQGLTKGMSAITEKHGITDWEASSVTYLGIGAGFAKAAVTQQQLDSYCSFLANGDQLKISALQQGFRQGK